MQVYSTSLDKMVTTINAKYYKKRKPKSLRVGKISLELNSNLMKNILKLKSLLLIFLITITVSCSKDKEMDASGTIEGTWNAVSCTNDGGIIKYGFGDHANVGIRFTLNLDGTYSWITDNTSSASSLPVMIKGTYIYTSTNSKLKVTGKATAGSFTLNDNHLYVIEKLTVSKLIIIEETEINGIGKQTYEFSR